MAPWLRCLLTVVLTYPAMLVTGLLATLLVSLLVDGPIHWFFRTVGISGPSLLVPSRVAAFILGGTLLVLGTYFCATADHLKAGILFVTSFGMFMQVIPLFGVEVGFVIYRLARYTEHYRNIHFLGAILATAYLLYVLLGL